MTVDWDAIWKTISGFYEGGGWGFQAIVIILLAVVIRVAAQFVIRRVVNRIVTGVK